MHCQMLAGASFSHPDLAPPPPCLPLPPPREKESGKEKKQKKSMLVGLFGRFLVLPGRPFAHDTHHAMCVLACHAQTVAV